MGAPIDKSQVPQATVPRLARYLRVLHRLERDGIPKVSSKELAERLDANAAQIRKDFSYFGEFGVRGVGYEVKYLIGELSRCLGLDQQWNIVIIGAGKLGGRPGALPGLPGGGLSAGGGLRLLAVRHRHRDRRAGGAARIARWSTSCGRTTCRSPS